MDATRKHESGNMNKKRKVECTEQDQQQLVSSIATCFPEDVLRLISNNYEDKWKREFKEATRSHDQAIGRLLLPADDTTEAGEAYAEPYEPPYYSPPSSPAYESTQALAWP